MGDSHRARKHLRMAIALAASSAFAVACVDDEAATTVDSLDAATDAVVADVVADGAAIPDVVADTLDEGLPPGCTCEGYSLGTDQHGIDCFAQLFGFALSIDPSALTCDSDVLVDPNAPDCIVIVGCSAVYPAFGFYDRTSGKLVSGYHEIDVSGTGCGIATTAGKATAACANACPWVSSCPGVCSACSGSCANAPPCATDGGVD